MDFKFQNLLGAPYQGGNLEISGDILLAPVGNRVSQIDLVKSKSSTLPFENRTDVKTLCASPDGTLLLSIDQDGRALVINRKKGSLLHHFSFKESVRVASFSPDGKYVAVGVGRLVQVWHRPDMGKTLNPMELHRTYGHCHADIVSLDWSEDGAWVVAGSKDLSVRVFSLNPLLEYVPPTLTGHKDVPMGVYFTTKKMQEAADIIGRAVPHLYTLSKDGALFAWHYLKDTKQTNKEILDGSQALEQGQTTAFYGGNWRLVDKYYFNQRGFRLTSAALHRGVGILAVGFSGGLFELLQLPDLTTIHTLSIGKDPITSIAFNSSGEWIAVGSSNLGQLLVWEWRSETYVLKQQGHAYDITSLDFSQDGSMLVTGAADSKVKIWTISNGFCFVTFSDHTAPVSAVRFVPSGHAVVSASLDGTVRAFDLVRYRNFRTLTSPTPVQFSSLAVDASGDIVVAGSKDTFEVFVWSLKTGRLLDILAGHEGPVIMTQFAPGSSMLATASWDATVRTWNVFNGKEGVDILQHNQDVLGVAWHPDGKHLASSTLDGQIYYWNAIDAEIEFVIHGRRDIAGGRSKFDRRAAGNSSSGRSFTSLAFSADGSFLLAGGSSKYVCVYDIKEQVMLRRFQITHNKAVDGVLDQLNSKYMTDAGPMGDIIDFNSDEDETDDTLRLLPGDVSKRERYSARTRCVSLSPTGRTWAAASPMGVLIYGLDDTLTFDPTDLSEDITPAAVLQCLHTGAYLRALLISIRLGDQELTQRVILCTPPNLVPSVVSTMPSSTAIPAIRAIGEMLLSGTPHLEHVLSWLKHICTRHSLTMRQQSHQIEPLLKGIQKSLSQFKDDLGKLCDSNIYSLRYLANSN